MSNSSNGRLWPYAIGAAITMVFGFCVATIVVTSKADLQPSDSYMTNYQNADKNANKLILAQLSFDKKYNVTYVTESIGGKNPLIQYKITDKDGNNINNATLIVKISRPETHEYNMELKSPKVEDGIYTFEGAKFPKAGVWNIIAKIDIGDDYRFLNIKADTRIKEAFEF